MIDLPDALDLYSFFEVDPVESDEWGYACSYTVSNSDGLSLTFSFQEAYVSIGVVLELHGREIMQVTGECVSSIKLRKDPSGHSLFIEFAIEGVASSAQIWVKPDIKVKWLSLRD